MPVITVAFALNAWLPLRWRLPSLVGVIGISILWLYGLTNGIMLLALALSVFLILSAPMGFRWRVALVVMIGSALIAFRTGWLSLVGAKSILP